MDSKKGQPSGGASAALIVVIAFFILIFLLLLPSEEREKILEGDDSGGVGSEVRVVERGVLLRESPGTITKLKEREFEHSVPSLNLFTEKEDVIIKRVDSVYVDSSGVSSRQFPVFAGAENSKVGFSVADHEGILTVDLNGEQVFRGDAGVVEPLSVDLRAENILEFSVDSPPAWQFWKKNFYDIRNVQVSTTVERLENKEAVNTFFVSQEEANVDNLEDAYIIYLVDCSVADVGRLSVYLNNNLLSSKVPDCGSLEKTFIDPADFIGGKNELRFVAEKGRYLVDQIFVKTKLKKPIFPVYFFDINSTQFAKIDNGTINASIGLKFIDDDERKTATIELNSHRIFVDTRSDGFSKNIDPFVIEGSNSLRITPEQTLHLLELKVQLDCRNAKDCE
ncbi:hypothetical protein HYX10_05265 [Candidatus Woesearchaeota archaeon]|nr:hypothetical protein [Candidatus Woesearchaeota archaeon]